MENEIGMMNLLIWDGEEAEMRLGRPNVACVLGFFY